MKYLNIDYGLYGVVSHLLREMWIEIIRAKSDASGFTESSPAGDVD